MKNKIISKLSILSLMVTLIVLSFNLNSSTKANALDIYNGYENKDVYQADDNTTHTVLWVEGVDAPKMTSDKSKFGQEGYFDQVKYTNKLGISSTYYQARYNDGSGYYDINKDLTNKMEKEGEHCYLVSAGNLLYWWMDRNKDNLALYKEKLKQGGTFENVSDLYPMATYNEEVWNMLEDRAPFRMTNKLLQRTESDSKLITQGLKGFYDLNSGFYADRPLDFFINGYQMGDIGGETITEEEFSPNHVAGYFHQIFGKQKLTKKYSRNRYSEIKEVIKDAILTGKGMSLSFYFGEASAHAVTLWGAEFDENDDLVRVYITDSDDADNAFDYNNHISRGLYTFDVNVTSDGLIRFTAEDERNDRTGGYFKTLYTLDSATDRFSDVLNDKEPDPQMPELEDVQDITTGVSGNVMIDFKPKAKDSGILTYQWYRANGLNQEGTPINGATASKYKPNTDVASDTYYYLEITNFKNGKTFKFKSRYVKVTVDSSIDIVHAAKPRIIKNIPFVGGNGIEVYQNSHIYLEVLAESPDNGKITYQWYVGYDPNKPVGSKLEGQTSNVFEIPAKLSEGRRFYFCEITNTNETVNGNQTNTIYTSIAKVYNNEGDSKPDAVMPSLSFDKTVFDINLGDSVTLNVNASVEDDGKLSYEWYETTNGFNNLVGSSQSITLSNLSSGVHKYIVKVTNTLGESTQTATSETIVVNVKEGETSKTFDKSNVTLSQKEYIYNGEKQYPKITITTKDGVLTGNDYRVEFNDDLINVGVKTFTIVGINDYDGVVLEFNYSIKQAENKINSFDLDKDNIIITSLFGSKDVVLKYYAHENDLFDQDIILDEALGLDKYYVRAFIPGNKNYKDCYSTNTIEFIKASDVEKNYKADLEAYIANINKQLGNLDIYTLDSRNAWLNTLSSFDSLLDKALVSLEELNNVKAVLEEASKGLVIRATDEELLNLHSKIEEFEKIKADSNDNSNGIYTSTSYQSKKNAYDYLVSAFAKGNNLTKTEYNNVIKAYDDIKLVLVNKPVESFNDELNEFINQIEKTDLSKYSKEQQAKFNDAIAKAKEKANGSSISKEEYEGIKSEINKVLDEILNSTNKPDEIPNPDDKPSPVLPIVLGVTIGLGVVLIVVAVVILFKKNNSRK